MHYMIMCLYMHIILKTRAIVRPEAFFTSLDGLDSGKIGFICLLYREVATFTVGFFEAILICSYFKDANKTP